jgi:signal transduction histidine kinase
MKNKLDKINDIFLVGSILIAIIFNIRIYYIAQNIEISNLFTIFSLLMISVLFIYRYNYKKYMENIFIQLSDMLDTIINMQNREVFSTIEDTLFSKLQAQTIKLTTILRNKNSEIEEERNQIQGLISDIAHQLKTPITNLKMYSQFLKDETLSEEERKKFNNIVIASLERLSFLVESMIKMSRLESGVISLKPTKNKLNDTILMAINQVQKKAKAKNIKLTLEEVDKVVINHDKNWIAEGVFNILENAVKYNKNNGVINIKVESYEMFVRIDIEDDGIGIEEEEIPKIFSRFYRGKNVDDTEGIGIGLYLTREIVSKHGGYIKVKSNNEGSIFSIFLPND